MARPPTKHHNPRSLRALVEMIVEDSGNDSDFGKRWCRHLEKITDGGASKRYDRVGKTEDNLRKVARKIIDDETQIDYWHLESVAHMKGLPTGVLLLFSRVKHNWSNAGREDTLHLKAALRELAEAINPDAEPDMEMLKAWQRIFKSQPKSEPSTE